MEILPFSLSIVNQFVFGGSLRMWYDTLTLPAKQQTLGKFSKLAAISVSEVGFEPTPPFGDQNSQPDIGKSGRSWVWRLRPLGHPDMTTVLFYFKINIQELAFVFSLSLVFQLVIITKGSHRTLVSKFLLGYRRLFMILNARNDLISYLTSKWSIYRLVFVSVKFYCA